MVEINTTDSQQVRLHAADAQTGREIELITQSDGPTVRLMRAITKGDLPSNAEFNTYIDRTHQLLDQYKVGLDDQGLRLVQDSHNILDSFRTLTNNKNADEKVQRLAKNANLAAHQRASKSKQAAKQLASGEARPIEKGELRQIAGDLYNIMWSSVTHPQFRILLLEFLDLFPSMVRRAGGGTLDRLESAVHDTVQQARSRVEGGTTSAPLSGGTTAATATTTAANLPSTVTSSSGLGSPMTTGNVGIGMASAPVTTSVNQQQTFMQDPNAVIQNPFEQQIHEQKLAQPQQIYDQQLAQPQPVVAGSFVPSSGTGVQTTAMPSSSLVQPSPVTGTGIGTGTTPTYGQLAQQQQEESKHIEVLTEDERNQLANRFRAVLQALSENPRYNQNVRRLLSIYDRVRETTLPQVRSQMSVDQEEQQMWTQAKTDSKALLGTFVGQQQVESYFSGMSSLMQDLRNDADARLAISEFRKYVNEGLDRPERLQDEDMRLRARSVIENLRNVLHDSRYRDRAHDVLETQRQMLKSIRQDQDLNNIGHNLQQLLQDAVMNPQSNMPDLNVALRSVDQARRFVFPLLRNQMTFVPIPAIHFKDPRRIEATIEDLSVNLKDAIPDIINLSLSSNLQVATNTIGPNRSVTNLVMTVSRMQPAVNDFRFRFNTLTFPRYEDAGRARIIFGGNGVSLRIVWAIEKVQGAPFSWVVQDCTCNIDKLTIDVIESRHKTLDRVVTRLLRGTIKRRLEKTIEQKLRDTLQGFQSRVVQRSYQSKGRVQNLASGAKNKVNTAIQKTISKARGTGAAAGTGATQPVVGGPTPIADTTGAAGATGGGMFSHMKNSLVSGVQKVREVVMPKKQATAGAVAGNGMGMGMGPGVVTTAAPLPAQTQPVVGLPTIGGAGVSAI